MPNGSDGAHLIETHTERSIREQAEERRRDARQRKLQTLFNGILMIATIAMAIVSAYQGYILRQTLKETQKQSAAAIQAVEVARESSKIQAQLMDAQLKEMRESSTRTWEQNKTVFEATAAHSKATLASAIENARLDQRAYVGLEYWTMEGFPGAITVSFVMKNTGRTPAIVTGLFQKFTVIAFLPEVPKYGEARKMSMPLSPGAGWQQRTNLPALDGENLGEIISKKKSIWDWGFISYRDQFKASHKIGFCMQYNTSNSKWELGGPTAYNYMD